jgi:hypothetical protein
LVLYGDLKEISLNTQIEDKIIIQIVNNFIVRGRRGLKWKGRRIQFKLAPAIIAPNERAIIGRV